MIESSSTLLPLSLSDIYIYRLVVVIFPNPPIPPNTAVAAALYYGTFSFDIFAALVLGYHTIVVLALEQSLALRKYGFTAIKPSVDAFPPKVDTAGTSCRVIINGITNKTTRAVVISYTPPTDNLIVN